MVISCFFTASATRKYRASLSRTPNCVVPKSTGRRTALPAHCPDNSHVGLMAILYNNIGKDLKLTPLRIRRIFDTWQFSEADALSVLR